MRFMASIVGSSWNSADSSGDAPIRSPAETSSELRASPSRLRTCVGQVLGPTGGYARVGG